LVDETTAIVRFIIPCGKPIENLFFRELAGDSFTGQTRELNKELKQLRWFFYHLFVESIVEVVTEKMRSGCWKAGFAINYTFGGEFDPLNKLCPDETSSLER